MRVITRCVIAAATAASALAVATAPAGAATGQLVLRGSGHTTVIVDPKAGCLSSGVGFSQVTNDTDVYVTVHTGLRCDGSGLVVSPGSTVSVGSRHSVRVPS
ncbi:hypothetical protein [Nonomuraea sp. NPDC049709]|uniref:hypothetical protein n=1 Tax=Nonomuraea sp. NPDC049709 TaxID=3154736 RepID=UPI0034283566